MAPRQAGTTPKRIIEAALEQFTERGFEGTSMRDLAGAVGVSTAALYYHYESKDALLLALVEPFLDSVEELLGKEAPVREFLEHYVDLLASHDELLKLIDLDPAVRSHPAVVDRLHDHTERLRSRLAGGRSDEEAQLRASAALGAIGRPVRMLSPDPALARRVLVDAALAILAGP